MPCRLFFSKDRGLVANAKVAFAARPCSLGDCMEKKVFRVVMVVFTFGMFLLALLSFIFFFSLE
jgi:hypothetical protein